MKELEILRNEIDEIDQNMVTLFEKRMLVVKKIKELKIKNNLPIYNKKREEELINKNLSLLNHQELKDYYLAFINKLIELSKDYQEH